MSPVNDWPQLTNSGDLVALGRHRLLCGDSTSSDDVARLFQGATAHAMITDPPYGADLVEKWESQKRMMSNSHDMNERRDGCEQDAMGEVEDYRVFYEAFLRRAPLRDVNCCYVFMSSSNMHLLRLACDATDVHVSDYLVWRKNCIVPGRRDYHSQYEAVLYGWRGKHAFYGKPHQSNVLDCRKNPRNVWHPCQKPLALVARLVRNATPPGVPLACSQTLYLQRHAQALETDERALVYDPFCGGGTTILACEYWGRVCYAVEKDPRRCDGIRSRWEQRSQEFTKLEGGD